MGVGAVHECPLQLINKKKRGKDMFKKFKEFAFKGNVIDMAVGVVVGGAFGKIVTSLVADIITPCIGMLTSGVSFKDLKYVLKAAEGEIPEVAINYGMFIQNIIDFFIIAISIFLFVTLIGKVKEKFEKKEEVVPEEPAKPTVEELLAEIRDTLKASK